MIEVDHLKVDQSKSIRNKNKILHDDRAHQQLSNEVRFVQNNSQM